MILQQSYKLAILTIILFLFLFFITSHHAAPCIYWGDDGEFLTAATYFDISHPPGHPLYVMFLRLVYIIPFGNIAFRGNLLSALLTAGQGVVLFYILLALYKKHNLSKLYQNRIFYKTVLIVFTLISTLYCLHQGIFIQSIRSETYALNGFLVTCLILTCILNNRAYLTGVFLWSLLLVNHFVTAIILTPVMLYKIVIHHKYVSIRFILRFVIFFMLGLSTWLYLPCRSDSAIITNTEHPDNYINFYNCITAQKYQSQLFKENNSSLTSIFRRNLQDLAFFVVNGKNITLIFWCICIILSLIFSIFNKSCFSIALFSTYILNIAFVSLSSFYTPDNMDFMGYLIPAILVQHVLIFMVIFSVSTKSFFIPKIRSSLYILLFIAIFILTLFSGYEANSLYSKRNHWQAMHFGLLQIEGLPYHCIIATQSDIVYLFYYLQYVEYNRKDIIVISRNKADNWRSMMDLYKLHPDLGKISMELVNPVQLLMNQYKKGNHVFWEMGEDAQRPSDIEETPHGFLLYWKPKNGLTFKPQNYSVIMNRFPDLQNAHNAKNDINKTEFMGMAFYNLGVYYYKNGQLDKAYDAYLRAVEYNPKDVRFLQNMGVLMAKTGNYAQAEKWFYAAIEIRPEHQKTWLNLGYCLELQRKYAPAKAIYEQGMKRFPDNSEFQSRYHDLQLRKD